MPGTSFFSDMLQGITERGRKLLFSASRSADSVVEADLETLCEMLLSSRGEASGMAIAAEILGRWSKLDSAGVEQFLQMLSEKFGADTAKLDKAVDRYRAEKSPAAIIALHRAAEPRRQELLRRLNHAPSGTAKLVRMRQQLLASNDRSGEYRALDADFTHLFGSWFNRGFLTLRPIDWSTPAHILEKIIKYEAVHEIAGWEELRRRLAPADRRCFAFFHPRLTDEPLVFVEVALTRSVPGAIMDVLDEGREQIDPDQATTAVFYSISNCQEGLRGISFGNFLIKQVVEDLRRDLPGLKNFVTLSPVPGFARWLARARSSDAEPPLTDDERKVLDLLDDPAWADDANAASKIEPLLLPLAAHYFLIERTPEGRPLDPVARFHLGNGARLERLNFLGDRSAKAMQQAHGLMVNYLYKLEDIEANHEALAQRGEVTASPAVKGLLGRNGESRRGSRSEMSRPFAQVMNDKIGGGRK
ncbi:MCD, Malonyl-CoA decarboxylase MCD [Sinorhizobium fredii USDA 205]|uniref:MCD, Malonyl-CoA decarboxylase MCD n=1 Tax=Rhizobium fredii TaxID=380 RepID=A0A844A4F6_RHIFR|nr:malonyl-CoA decarboxylase [Sinorhizobium fredii]ASY71689.1 Malonyl-CoA decarboxylase [Sinorhizobium fredii CCBAU 83666]KSV87595.1 MCD, Malonyl-CoA decarboxylase MCD [Sinorhizobium fredii USDA 205]MQX07853.1 MCD, Malonyl-CoA decarboxylase MCD [Sinorhizobium fredii]GEC31970.1 MCD, Malonyl-CoA decarboxylase MCD [Sinorhizobium fredii]GLS08011.1 MCD, Malonyl-CoA decarboxylase MCD [Sinorhizobium fredii]